MTEESRREAKLRRAARTQGPRLVKSRARDPRAVDFGGFMLVQSAGGMVEAGAEGIGRPHWSLEEVERYLRADR